jgi:hypothetical protein
LSNLAQLDRSLRRQRKALRAEQRSQAQNGDSVCGRK